MIFPPWRKILRFAIIGGAATSIHLGVALLLHYQLDLPAPQREHPGVLLSLVRFIRRKLGLDVRCNIGSCDVCATFFRRFPRMPRTQSGSALAGPFHRRVAVVARHVSGRCRGSRRKLCGEQFLGVCDTSNHRWCEILTAW